MFAISDNFLESVCDIHSRVESDLHVSCAERQERPSWQAVTIGLETLTMWVCWNSTVSTSRRYNRSTPSACRLCSIITELQYVYVHTKRLVVSSGYVSELWWIWWLLHVMRQRRTITAAVGSFVYCEQAAGIRVSAKFFQSLSPLVLHPWTMLASAIF
jgi:hypothetical protein